MGKYAPHDKSHDYCSE
jgi:hypothetical protein